MNMDDFPSVDAHQRGEREKYLTEVRSYLHLIERLCIQTFSLSLFLSEPSFTPSPTPSSSPANSSGYEPSESSDTSPVPNRAAGRRASTPHTPGPGLPRGSDTESSSSSDELNISSDSNAIPMDFDKNHQDSLLSNEIKPLVENMEVSSASEMVTNTTQSLQEVKFYITIDTLV